jgi:hypothetical protein
VQKNQESIRRLEQMAATEFQRTAEQQSEIDSLKKAMLQEMRKRLTSISLDD